MKKINWDEKALLRWIGTDERPRMARSRHKYKTAFRHYAEFTRMTANTLINQMAMEYKGERTEMGETKGLILDFYHYLTVTRKTPLASKTAHAYIGAIRSFYSKNNVEVKFGKNEIPKPNVRYERRLLSRYDVLKLTQVAEKNSRNKAIIVCMYQSGMDVSTLLSLDVSHVQNQLRSGKKRILLRVVRQKTRVKYRTFFGRDATQYLRTYLETRGNLKAHDPLFVGRYNDRLKPLSVHKMLKILVVKAKLLTEAELKPFNPMGSHALRESFSKTATGAGFNSNIIDGLLGHKLPYGGAYSRLSDSELERVYADLEPRISLSETQQDKSYLTPLITMFLVNL